MLTKRIARRFSAFYSFKTGLPVSFQESVPLPLIQKEYQEMIYDKELECCDHSNIDFLYKLYQHSILTRKPYILSSFVEPLLADRIDQFCRLITETGLKLSVSEEFDSAKGVTARVSKCRLTKTDSPDFIRKSIRDLYADIDVKVTFRGSLRVFGVSHLREENKTFLDYQAKAARGELVYTEKMAEIPSQIREKIASDTALEKLGEAKGVKLSEDEIVKEKLKKKKELGTVGQVVSLSQGVKGKIRSRRYRKSGYQVVSR